MHINKTNFNKISINYWFFKIKFVNIQYTPTRQTHTCRQTWSHLLEGLHLETTNNKNNTRDTIAHFVTILAFDTFHQIKIEFIQFDSFKYVLFLSSDHFFRWKMKLCKKEKQQNITKYVRGNDFKRERKSKKKKKNKHLEKLTENRFRWSQ